MNGIKKYTLVIFLICLYLSINFSLADDDLWNFDYVQKITTISTQYPIPLLFETPDGCAFPDCRDIRFEDDIPYKLLDLDNNGIPEYVFLITNLKPEDLDSPSKIEYSNLPPVITYENETIIHELSWSICYENNNSLYCQPQNIGAELTSESDIYVNFFNADLRNRFDIYSIIKYNLSSDVDSICPLVLDLGAWPQEMMYFDIKTQIEDDIELYGSSIKLQNDFEYIIVHNDEIYFQKDGIIFKGPEVYGGSLILNGLNKSIIITKPSNGKLNPSPNYYFLIQLLPNKHVVVSVHSKNKEDELLPPKGPNAYIVFGKPDYKKLIDLSFILEYIPKPIIGSPESIKAKFYEAKIGANFKLTRPEIEPKIKFNTNDNLFSSQNFTFKWMTQDGEKNKTIQSQNGSLIFDETIFLNKYDWKYPFDTYEATVYVDPPIIQNDVDIINMDFDNKQLNGKADFRNNLIILTFGRTFDTKLNYILVLIFSIIIFTFLLKYIKKINSREFTSEKWLFISSFIIANHLYYFISFSEQHFSIGSVPYIFMLLWLGQSIYLKNKKTESRQPLYK